MQTDPKDVLKALDIIEAAGNPKNLFVKGWRKGRPVFDQFWEKGSVCAAGNCPYAFRHTTTASEASKILFMRKTRLTKEVSIAV